MQHGLCHTWSSLHVLHIAKHAHESNYIKPSQFVTLGLCHPEGWQYLANMLSLLHTPQSPGSNSSHLHGHLWCLQTVHGWHLVSCHSCTQPNKSHYLASPFPILIQWKLILVSDPVVPPLTHILNSWALSPTSYPWLWTDLFPAQPHGLVVTTPLPLPGLPNAIHPLLHYQPSSSAISAMYPSMHRQRQKSSM